MSARGLAQPTARLTLAICLATTILGPPIESQSSGPDAAYAFDDGSGTTALDWSGNGHTADLVDGPAWTSTGRFGGAVQFDGIDDGVRLPVSSLLELTGSFSVGAWIRPTAAHTVRQHIVQTSGPDSNGLSLTADGRPKFGASFGSGSMEIEGADVVPIGSWTHLGATYNGSTVVLYMNGSAVASAAVSGDDAGTDQMWIGRARVGGKLFAGEIDEVRFYRRALTAAELLLDLNSPVDPDTAFQVSTITPFDNAVGVITTPITATMSDAVDAATVTTTTVRVLNGAGNPVAASVSYDSATHRILVTPNAALASLTTYTVVVSDGSSGVKDATGRTIAADTSWSFQTAAFETLPSLAYAFSEGAGSTTADASGNGNTGLLVNGPAWTTSGYFGSALTFDGTDDGVSVPLTDAVALSTAFTLEAWVNPTANADSYILMLKRSSRLWAVSPSHRRASLQDAVQRCGRGSHGAVADSNGCLDPPVGHL